MGGKVLRIILNGKKAALPQVRNAVQRVRKDGNRVEVRVTWKAAMRHNSRQKPWMTTSMSSLPGAVTAPSTRW